MLGGFRKHFSVARGLEEKEQVKLPSQKYLQFISPPQRACRGRSQCLQGKEASACAPGRCL